MERAWSANGASASPPPKCWAVTVECLKSCSVSQQVDRKRYETRSTRRCDGAGINRRKRGSRPTDYRVQPRRGLGRHRAPAEQQPGPKASTEARSKPCAAHRTQTLPRDRQTPSPASPTCSETTGQSPSHGGRGMNKADHFFRTGEALCDECDRRVEPARVERAGGLGPFLCQSCANAIFRGPHMEEENEPR